MTSGHGVNHSKPPGSEARLRVYLRDPQVAKRLRDMEAGKVPVDNEHDLPFLGGTTGKGSNWGLAFDRHLPKTIALKNMLTGKVDDVDPRLFLRWHEGFERALMDIFGLPYLRAHVFAELLEDQKVEEAGYDPAEYERKLRPMIKSDEAERIVSPPPRLDKRPYLQDHDQSDNAKAIRKRLAAA